MIEGAEQQPKKGAPIASYTMGTDPTALGGNADLDDSDRGGVGAGFGGADDGLGFGGGDRVRAGEVAVDLVGLAADLRGRGADGVGAVAVRDADHLGNPGEAVGDQKGVAADRDQCYVAGLGLHPGALVWAPTTRAARRRNTDFQAIQGIMYGFEQQEYVQESRRSGADDDRMPGCP